MIIDPAKPEDLPQIQSIYAYHVLTGTGTFEETPPSLEEMQARFKGILASGYAWLVARDDMGVQGFAYYGPFRARAAYRFLVEDSVYVRKDARGQGVGEALLVALVEAAKAGGFREMLAVIGDTQNHGSVKLHGKLGFEHTGTMRGVGFKFNRWLDVVLMQKTLG